MTFHRRYVPVNDHHFSQPFKIIDLQHKDQSWRRSPTVDLASGRTKKNVHYWGTLDINIITEIMLHCVTVSAYNAY